MAPQQEADKIVFLNELNALQHSIQGEWLVIGHFNLIYKAEDKNNLRFNRRLMGRFKSVLDNLELRELPVHGRRFTWTSSCSAQAEVTMTKIDRVFFTNSLEELFPTAHLYAWASTCSDHCPYCRGTQPQENSKALDLNPIGSRS
jgi:exonuclease III